MHLEMRKKGWHGWCQEYGNPLSKWGVMLGVEDGDFQTFLSYIGETLSQTKQNIHFTLSNSSLFFSPHRFSLFFFFFFCLSQGQDLSQLFFALWWCPPSQTFATFPLKTFFSPPGWVPSFQSQEP